MILAIERGGGLSKAVFDGDSMIRRESRATDSPVPLSVDDPNCRARDWRTAQFLRGLR